MSKEKERQEIGNNLDWARAHLVCARKCMQEGQALVDQRGIAGFGNNHELELAKEKFKEATFHKAGAKRELVEAEKQAGRDFLHPFGVVLGARDLDGGHFKDWPTYLRVFAPETFVDRWSR